MVKITVRKASVALLGAAALAQGAAACAPSADRAEDSAYETTIGSKSAAYSVPSPGEAKLVVDYFYSGSGAPQKTFVVQESTTDEFLRVGQKLTLNVPGWAITALVQTDTGNVDVDNVSKSKVRLAITWLHGPAVLSQEVVKVASWNAEGMYGWPDAITEAFVIPKGATGMRVAVEATSPDGTKTGREVFREVPVFGGELPNKHVLFDLGGDGPRSRVLERGAPIAGAELSLAYTENRAERLVDVGSVDRRIGRVKTYNPRFGTHEADVFGEIVHIIAVGYDFGGGWQKQELVSSPQSYVRYGKSQETRLHVPDGATKLSMYFHVKTYLVAKYPTYGEVTERRYGEGEWILMRERYDNPSGAGTNFAFDTETKEPASPAVARTVVFIEGETQPGQDLFIRGGMDHEASKKLRGIDCANEDGTPNYRCAIPIIHRNMKNATTRPWRLGDAFLDWYGREPTQLVSSGALSQGTAADWTTNDWPTSWGPQKTVAVDGYGLEPLNDVGPHLWMLDVDMDCTKAFEAADGTRWFEVKSFVSNGPGWEGDVTQEGAPYASPNHLAKCGQVSIFERGSSRATFRALR
ncbi:MAG: hypothetical protein HYV09_04235 [Deltaproteobacteria bacterium]|nr:hypothetical protein [Deltaproteobacteria bacterium]